MKVHTVKEIAGNIAAETLYETAATLEKALYLESYEQVETSKEFFDQIEALYVMFKEAITILVNEIQLYTVISGKMPATTITGIDPDKAQLLIAKLYPLLMEGNIESADLTDEIREIWRSTAKRALADQLIRQILNMDFEEAADTLNIICI